jgi:hypothetical protein
MSVLTGSAKTHAADARTSRALVTAFLDATSEVNGDLEKYLVVTDGARSWEPDALDTVTTATATDPAWLRLRAAVNNAFAQQE